VQAHNIIRLFAQRVRTAELPLLAMQEDVLYLSKNGGSQPRPAPSITAAAPELGDQVEHTGDGDLGGVDSAEETESDDEDEENADEAEEGHDDEELRDLNQHHTVATAVDPQSTLSSVSAQSGDRAVMKFMMPWAEVVTHLNDAVKSLTAGYASLDWSPGGYAKADGKRPRVQRARGCSSASCAARYYARRTYFLQLLKWMYS
jgi:hypothetical protein